MYQICAEHATQLDHYLVRCKSRVGVSGWIQCALGAGSSNAYEQGKSTSLRHSPGEDIPTASVDANRELFRLSRPKPSYILRASFVFSSELAVIWYLTSFSPSVSQH